MATIDANFWNLSPAEHCRHSSAVHELGNLRAALDWVVASDDDRALAYELLGRCWPVWMLNGLTGEGVQRMLQLWPPPPNSANQNRGGLLSGLCSAQQRRRPRGTLGGRASRHSAVSETRRCGPARRCPLGCRDNRCAENQMSEAEQALREAEKLVTATAALRKQAALAATQGQCYVRRGAPQLRDHRISSPSRAVSLCRRHAWRECCASATWVALSSMPATWIQRSNRCASRSMVCVESTRPTELDFVSARWRSLWPGAVMTSTFFRSRARRSTITACLV